MSVRATAAILAGAVLLATGSPTHTWHEQHGTHLETRAPARTAQTPQSRQPVQAPPLDPVGRRQHHEQGASILRGIVVDRETGAPIRGAQVVATAIDGGRGVGVSDKDGRFEVGGLSRGRYVVTVHRIGYPPVTHSDPGRSSPAMIAIGDGDVVGNLTISIPQTAVITGRVLNEFGDPVAGVEVLALQLQYVGATRQLVRARYGGIWRTDDLGGFRLWGLEPGRYYLSAQPFDGPGLPATAEVTQGPVTTYFPDAIHQSAAQPIAAVAGRETTDLVIVLAMTTLATIKGRAVRSDGEPFSGASIHLVPRDVYASFGRSGGPGIGADGTFEIAGVPPGAYDLVVYPPGGGDDDGAEVARTPVTVAGADIDGLLVVGGRRAVASGRLVTDDGSPLRVRPSDLRVTGEPAAPGATGSLLRGWPRSRVHDDYTFELRGLEGEVLLRAYPAGDAGRDWSLKSVLFNGQEITDTPFRFELNQIVEGIELVLTRKVTELSGTVSDTSGQPVSGIWLITFPADPALWYWRSRYVRAMPSDADGKYRMRGLPPYRDYRLVALPSVEIGQWGDPEFLESISAQGTRVSLGEGETRVQNVRVERQP